MGSPVQTAKSLDNLLIVKAFYFLRTLLSPHIPHNIFIIFKTKMIKTYTTKRAIIDLMIVREQVTKFYADNNKYKDFLEFIFAKDYLDDNDLKLPTIKEISKATGLTSNNVTKLIKELYADFLDKELEFSKVEVIYQVSYFRKHLQLKFTNTSYLPRIGEQVDLSFVNAELGTGMFYVDKVKHTFENDVQRISITLKAGVYNSYFQFRKSKAFAEGEISINEFYLDDFDLKRKLNIHR